MIPPEEQIKRRYNVEQAFHSTRLEGEEPSKESIDLADRWVRGEITLEEWLNTIKLKHGIEDAEDNN